MCAEGIVFHGSSPVAVDHARTILFRTDAVHPVIFIGEAAARPAKNRNVQLLQGIYNIRTHTVYVGNRGVLPYKNTLINAASQMLGKVTINFLVDFAFFHGRKNA